MRGERAQPRVFDARGARVAARVDEARVVERRADFQVVHVVFDGDGKIGVGKNTIDCMRAGIIFSNVDMIDGILDRMERELGEPATAVATGGLARFITPLCRHKIHYDDALLLKGLLILYRKNA